MSQQQPLASSSQRASTPSRADGISEELELDLRAFGAMIIQQSGLQLSLPQIVMCTACILFQRFWFVTSLKHFGVMDIALSCLFLASKLEEVGPPPLRVRDIANVFDYIQKRIDFERGQLTLETARKRISQLGNGAGAASAIAAVPGATASFRYEPMDYFAKEFFELKEETVIGEMQILKRLGFHLTAQHPYGALANYLRILDLSDHATVPQRAWNYCNDALLTPALAVYTPFTVAAAAIYLACLPDASGFAGVAVPMAPRPWWTLFDVASEDELLATCETILSAHARWSDRSAWRLAAERGLPLTKDAVRSLPSARAAQAT